MEKFFDDASDVKGDHCGILFMRADELYALALLIVAICAHRELEVKRGTAIKGGSIGEGAGERYIPIPVVFEPELIAYAANRNPIFG